jgi:flavodoxin
MKTIIVYYSLEENTHYAAQKIAENIGADLLRLHPKKAYPRGGFKKFFWGGKSAVMAQKPALEPYAFKAEEYERVIIGFPVWASNVAPPLRTFVSENDVSGKHLSAFACQSGSGAQKAFAKLAAAAGVEKLENELILIDPKTKPSAENERKIKEFCDTLNKTEET